MLIILHTKLFLFDSDKEKKISCFIVFVLFVSFVLSTFTQNTQKY